MGNKNEENILLSKINRVVAKINDIKLPDFKIDEESDRFIKEMLITAVKAEVEYVVKDIFDTITDNIKFVKKTTLTVSLAAIPLLIGFIDKFECHLILFSAVFSFLMVVLLQVNMTNRLSNIIDDLIKGNERQEKKALLLIKDKFHGKMWYKKIFFSSVAWFNLGMILSVVSALLYILEQY